MVSGMSWLVFSPDTINNNLAPQRGSWKNHHRRWRVEINAEKAAVCHLRKRQKALFFRMMPDVSDVEWHRLKHQ
jgi:hypothetical protein